MGDYPKNSAPGVRLLQPLCDKSPPFPGWGGGVGLCIDRCIILGKWKTRKAGTGTGTETETGIRKRSSDLKVSIVRVDGNSMQVCWYGDG